MKGAKKLKEAIDTKSLTALTKAIGLAGDELAYQLKPPYTELLELRAKEEDEKFNLHFRAKLHLHYSSRTKREEGLVFMIQFSGDAFSDTPVPALSDLFYAGIVELLQIYGYGDGWNGTATQFGEELSKSLELPATAIREVKLNRLYKVLDKGS